MRTKEPKKIIMDIFNCAYCGKEVTREKKNDGAIGRQNKFCDRACAAKKNRRSFGYSY